MQQVRHAQGHQRFCPFCGSQMNYMGDYCHLLRAQELDKRLIEHDNIQDILSSDQSLFKNEIALDYSLF